MEDLSKKRRLKSLSDLMMDVEDEIEQVKSGALKESQARIVARNRGLQMKGFELWLLAIRLEPKVRGELVRRLGLEPPAIDLKPKKGATAT